MREEKVFRLGRLLIDGDIIEFEPESALDFEAARRDIISVGVQYDYREVTEDKERAKIRLTASVDGGPTQTHEIQIADNPLLNDSRRGFVSVPVRVGGSGEMRGRFVLEAVYASGPWRARAGDETEWRERAEGEFTLRIR